MGAGRFATVEYVHGDHVWTQTFTPGAWTTPNKRPYSPTRGYAWTATSPGTAWLRAVPEV